MARMNVEDYRLRIQAAQAQRVSFGQRQPQQKRRKYRNEVTYLDDMRFDSKAEARRWSMLKLMERAGEISDLKAQVVFDLLPAQEVSGRKEKQVQYIADFTYQKDGKMIIEDVKSGPTKTPEFVIKRKLMMWIHGFIVHEVMVD